MEETASNQQQDTDVEVLEELQRKEIEKTKKEAIKNAKKSEREQKKERKRGDSF